MRARWQLSTNDPLVFARFFVNTLDQKDKKHPAKPFPAHRPHLVEMFRLFNAVYNRELLIRDPKTGEMIEASGIVDDKCRQIMATWFGCIVSLWDVLFHPGRLVFLQSKREEDAVGDEISGTGLLGRCKYILRHIDGLEALEPRLNLDKHLLTNKIQFPWNNSTLWAIPQGGDIIRSHTPSGWFADECGFWEFFGPAYSAAMAGLRGGGWFYGCSTANPGEYNDLIKDQMK